MKRLPRSYTAHESRCSTLWPTLHLAVLLLFFLLGSVAADCECGYSTSVDGASHVFTDLIESDFTRVRDISDDTDWSRQAFNMSSEVARGDFGEMFVVDNVASGSTGTEKGLQLIVQGQNVEENMVPGAEIDTEREDVLWGTFRAGLKLTSIPGTCAAFFWYYNDTAEIDMEFLSKDFDTSNNSYPVNLVLHSKEASQAGYNAGNYIETNLPFNPTTDFHEYRIDFIPGKVLFYADGQLLGQVNGSAVPTMAGHLVLQHWSNGNPLWSGGPPTTDAVLAVSYVKAYFNSSTEERNKDWAGRCKDMSGPDSVCEIPEVTASNSTPGQFFFSDQNNMTNNQTVSGENGGRRLEYGWLATLLRMVLAYSLVLGLW
ncbi:concanavalin A-like lectin/glucanase [Coniochaeta ligniaria NRRL 30616]|uniref:Concanavalin A-like lectin/glucanase n=1 Tax=Coniochaeta ligniaria NRRL 30616 TaxID=1408157 RepID=A0A1J7JX64_9PEZI|nr:concanavalin A-like lectin/glucanase [Coniochaeta ligniaria NRRL 30616]